MLHEERHLTARDGVQLYAQCWLPDGPAKANLAVVHGIGEHSGRYANFGAWFAPKGYAVHALDCRGHGRSEGRRGHIQHWMDFREDTRAFLASVSAHTPDVPTFLVGHSLGGLIVLDYGLHAGEAPAGVIASGPALATGEGVPSFLLFLSRILSAITPKVRMHNQLDLTGLSRDDAVVRAYRADPLVHDFVTPRLAAELQRVMQQTLAHASEWPADLPLLIVHGAADILCPPYASERFYAGAGARDKTRYVYPEFRHEVFNEIGRERVLQDVEDWLAAHL